MHSSLTHAISLLDFSLKKWCVRYWKLSRSIVFPTVNKIFSFLTLQPLHTSYLTSLNSSPKHTCTRGHANIPRTPKSQRATHIYNYGASVTITTGPVKLAAVCSFVPARSALQILIGAAFIAPECARARLCIICDLERAGARGQWAASAIIVVLYSLAAMLFYLPRAHVCNVRSRL